MSITDKLVSQLKNMSLSHYRFTQEGRVPPNTSCMLVVDDDSTVKTQFENMFLDRINQIHLKLITRNIENNSQKIQLSPQIYIVEAGFGDEALYTQQRLMNKGCKVHVVFLKHKLKSDDSLQMAKNLREQEKQHLGDSLQINQSLLLVGYGEQNQSSSNVYDVIRAQPLCESSTKKLVKTLISNLSNEKKREKMLEALV